MSVQAPEKPEIKSRIETLPEVPDVAQEDGLKIAREAFMRGLWRFSGQAFIGLFAVTLLFFAGKWSLSEMKNLPSEAPKLVPQQVKDFAAYLFTPQVSKVDIPVGQKAETASEVKPQVVSRPRRSQARRKVAVHKPQARHRYNQNLWFSDPAGGRVSYSDGTITEYSWK